MAASVKEEVTRESSASRKERIALDGSGVHLLAYGTGPFGGSALRLEEQARGVGVFSTIHVYKALPDFVREDPRWSRHLAMQRGAGYWFWKSVLAKPLLRSLPEGDLLLYVDCGCGLTKEGWPALLEKARGFDLLGFQLRGENSERRWTKGDVFAHFGVSTESEIARSGQIVATYFFVRNSAAGRRFVERWEELVADFHLVSDEPSREANGEDFHDHRHDQSLLSMLAKSGAVPELRVRLEAKKFPEARDFPIHTWRRRDRIVRESAVHGTSPEEIVAGSADGSIELRAAEATLHGAKLRRESRGGMAHIGHWDKPAEWVDWSFTVADPGRYRVTVEVAAKKRSEFTVSSGARVLHGSIAPTGGFDRFETVDVGCVELPSSERATLSVKPVAERWNAMNLRAVTLTAVASGKGSPAWQPATDAAVARGSRRDALGPRGETHAPRASWASHVKSLVACDKIFLLHMRKAAGTTMRQLLAEVVRRRGLEVEVLEGWPFDAGRLDERRTFFVTSLREPFERVCSLYNFGGRWPENDRVKAPENAVPFETWFEAPEPRPKTHRQRLWTVAREYYVKTLGGFGFRKRGEPQWLLNPDGSVSEENYHRAVRVLNRFDLVIICEWLQNEEYRARITRALLGERASPIPIPRSNRTVERQAFYDVRDHLTPELRRRVAEGNRWDDELYRFGRRRSAAQLGWSPFRRAQRVSNRGVRAIEEPGRRIVRRIDGGSGVGSMPVSEERPVVWNVVGNNFRHKTGGHNGRCATHGKLPRHVTWSFDGRGEATFYLDENIRRGVDDGIGGVKYGWLLESRSIRPEITEHLKQHYERYFATYRAIFTHNQELLALDERFKFTVTCGFWIVDVGIHEKSKRVSVVNSGKTKCEGHRWRNAFIDRHRHELDLFGDRYRHIPRKELALNDYMFSVAIENGSYATYFTEKILDCFATGTIPVYRGAPDIGDFFNAEGIVPIDDDFRFADLTEDFYYSRMDAIRDNFERVQKMETAEDWTYRRYRDELFRVDDAKTRRGALVILKARSSPDEEARAESDGRRSSAERTAAARPRRRKVFGIGMFKTGTTSFGRAMQALGFRSEWRFWPILPEQAAYFDLDTEKFRPFHDRIRQRADEFDCLADAPWLYLYRELAEWYPDSLFVLTLRRDARRVAESDLAMWRRIGLMERWRRDVGPEPTPEMFVQRYDRHNQAVVRYFENQPDRLLVVCWETDPSPWRSICEFIGVPIPRQPFPHLNRRGVNRSD